MGLSIKHRRKALWIGLLLLALLVPGCAGITPYKARDHREEGPERGIFSGAEGEFIIYREVNEPEAGKKRIEATDGQQP